MRYASKMSSSTAVSRSLAWRKLDKALALIEGGACDAAIVDANLAGVSARPAAIALSVAACLLSCCPVTRRSKCRVTIPERFSFLSLAGQSTDRDA